MPSNATSWQNVLLLKPIVVLEWTGFNSQFIKGELSGSHDVVSVVFNEHQSGILVTIVRPTYRGTVTKFFTGCNLVDLYD